MYRVKYWIDGVSAEAKGNNPIALLDNWTNGWRDTYSEGEVYRSLGKGRAIVFGDKNHGAKLCKQN